MPENLNNPSTSEQNPNNSWDDMDTKAETNNSEPSLADRIRSEMTLAEINELDIKNLPDAEYEAVKERVKQFRETGNAGPIVDESTKVVEEKIEKVEQIEKVEKPELSPEVQELKQKAKEHSGFAGILNKVKEVLKDPKTRRKVGAVALAAATAAGAIGFAGHEIAENLFGNAETKPDKQIEQNEEAETTIGIKDGYGEEGLYLSENKTGPYNFSCGEEVEKVCGGDHHKELEYVAENQVESLADYIANMPDEVKPDGFEGLTILEAEKKLESLSDEDYEKAKKQFKESVEKSTVKETTINGECDNAYIYKKDGAEAIHENMELVSSVTTEKNTPIIEYSWVDENGNVLDTLQVKKVCRQAVNRKGLRTKVYSGMKVIHLNHPGDPGKGDNPTPSPDNPPQPKNQKEADENSGAAQGIVTPEKQERQYTPEPSADEAHPYNQGTNTYDYTPKEQAEKIGYEVNKTDNATVGTGEVTGNTPSADGSGDTIEKNLNEATGVEGANYNQGF